jgi:hypothetical protein
MSERRGFWARVDHLLHLQRDKAQDEAAAEAIVYVHGIEALQDSSQRPSDDFEGATE